jgi:hypothetical protein
LVPIKLHYPARQPSCEGATQTPTVETVEKVPLPKMIFEKWDRNAEKGLVFVVPHNISTTFWQFFGPLWEIFMNVFRTKGFSTVSLGGRRERVQREYI